MVRKIDTRTQMMSKLDIWAVTAIVLIAISRSKYNTALALETRYPKALQVFEEVLSVRLGCTYYYHDYQHSALASNSLATCYFVNGVIFITFLNCFATEQRRTQ